MPRFNLSVSSLVGLLLASANFDVSNAQTCPPPGLDALASFDFPSFYSAPFFTISGSLTFLPAEDFNCFVQTSEVAASQNLPFFCNFLPFLCTPDFDGQFFVDILFTSRADNVNGRLNRQPLRGITVDPAGSARLINGPAFVPPAFYQDLFIVAAGTFADLLNPDIATADLVVPSSTNYEWAITSSGVPPVSTGNGCLFEEPGTLTFDGVSIVSRDPLPSAEIVNRITDIATFLGYDTTQFVNVVQEGCTFDFDF